MPNTFKTADFGTERVEAAKRSLAACLVLANLFDSGTIAGPHTDYVCAWSEHSIALSHVSSVYSWRDCSRR
jgi:hypothetical protein